MFKPYDYNDPRLPQTLEGDFAKNAALIAGGVLLGAVATLVEPGVILSKAEFLFKLASRETWESVLSGLRPSIIALGFGGAAIRYATVMKRVKDLAEAAPMAQARKPGAVKTFRYALLSSSAAAAIFIPMTVYFGHELASITVLGPGRFQTFLTVGTIGGGSCRLLYTLSKKYMKNGLDYIGWRDQSGGPTPPPPAFGGHGNGGSPPVMP